MPPEARGLERAWGYRCEHGFRSGRPPADVAHDVVERACPRDAGRPVEPYGDERDAGSPRPIRPSDVHPGDVIRYAVHADRHLRGTAIVGPVAADRVVATTLEGDLLAGQIVAFAFEDVDEVQPAPTNALRPHQAPHPERIATLKPGDLVAVDEDGTLAWLVVRKPTHDGAYGVAGAHQVLVPVGPIAAVESAGGGDE